MTHKARATSLCAKNDEVRYISHFMLINNEVVCMNGAVFQLKFEAPTK